MFAAVPDPEGETGVSVRYTEADGGISHRQVVGNSYRSLYIQDSARVIHCK